MKTITGQTSNLSIQSCLVSAPDYLAVGTTIPTSPQPRALLGHYFQHHYSGTPLTLRRDIWNMDPLLDEDWLYRVSTQTGSFSTLILPAQYAISRIQLSGGNGRTTFAVICRSRRGRPRPHSLLRSSQLTHFCCSRLRDGELNRIRPKATRRPCLAVWFSSTRRPTLAPRRC